MAESKLVLHCGAREVGREELDRVPTPAPTQTWFPVPHGQVVDAVGGALEAAGFSVTRARYGLSRHDARMFATLDVASTLLSGVTVAVGIRNSLDKSLPLGFCAGSRVFCCDNLSFRSELLVTRKHTRFGEERFQEAIARAVQSLQQFKEEEAVRIKRFQETELPDVQADSLILRAFERDIVSHRVLPQVLTEWRTPSHEEFQDRTLWSLFNAFTTALGAGVGKSNPQRFCGLTMRLQGLLGEAAGLPAASEALHVTPA
jgi:hypothetical protein